MLKDILVNLLADFIFILLVVFLFWILWYWIALSKARKFFNLRNNKDVNIYISVHEDQDTNTRYVATVAEYEAANILRNELNGQLRESVFGKIAVFLSGLLGHDPKIPNMNIITENSNGNPKKCSAISIGGPVRNKFSKYLI